MHRSPAGLPKSNSGPPPLDSGFEGREMGREYRGNGVQLLLEACFSERQFREQSQDGLALPVPREILRTCCSPALSPCRHTHTGKRLDRPTCIRDWLTHYHTTELSIGLPRQYPPTKKGRCHQKHPEVSSQLSLSPEGGPGEKREVGLESGALTLLLLHAHAQVPRVPLLCKSLRRFAGHTHSTRKEEGGKKSIGLIGNYIGSWL